MWQARYGTAPWNSLQRNCVMRGMKGTSYTVQGIGGAMAPRCIMPAHICCLFPCPRDTRSSRYARFAPADGRLAGAGSAGAEAGGQGAAHATGKQGEVEGEDRRRFRAAGGGLQARPVSQSVRAINCSVLAASL